MGKLQDYIISFIRFLTSEGDVDSVSGSHFASVLTSSTPHPFPELLLAWNIFSTYPITVPDCTHVLSGA